MENINDLRNQFKNAKDRIENYLFLKDYANAKIYIEQAVKILQKLMRADTNIEYKEVYKKAFDQLQEKYTLCKTNLNEPVLVVNTNKKTKPISNKTNQNKQPNTNKDSDDGICYEFNGRDIKPFLATESNDVVTFNDVIGMEKEKALINSEFFISEKVAKFNEKIGKKQKNFIMLYGLPGTGKTFFAKAISHELSNHVGKDVPFYSVICSQLKDSKVGETENRLIALFEFTKQFDNCVLFMDEFEMVGLSRQLDSGDPTIPGVVATLLQLIDGFNSNKGLLLIVSTNTPYKLDGAIISRMNAQIEVPLPTYDIIYPTLKRKLGEFISNDVDLEKIAKKLDGFSNRDVKNFIQKVLDIYSREYSKDETKDISEFKISNEFINEALKDSGSTIKDDERRALDKYRNN